MNWAATGLEYLRQHGLQLYWQAWNWFDARRLVKAETALGELGWQQADFPPDVEATIATLNRIENEQGDLFNQSSEVSAEITTQQEARAARRAEYDAARRGVVGKITPIRAAVDEEEKARGAQQKLTASLREHLPDLEKKQRQNRFELEQLGRVQEPTLTVEQLAEERARLHDLMAATASAMSAAHEGMKQALEKIRVFDDRIAALMPGLNALQSELEALDTAFNAADHERAQQLQTLQLRKSGIERQLSSLDFDKSGYFLIVGRCLADAHIPPMNQPDALQRVLDLRGVLAMRQTAISQSRAWTAAVLPAVLLKLAALAVGVIVLVWIAFHFLHRA